MPAEVNVILYFKIHTTITMKTVLYNVGFNSSILF